MATPSEVAAGQQAGDMMSAAQAFKDEPALLRYFTWKALDTAKAHNAEFPADLYRRICRGCCVPLLPATNCRVRVVSRSARSRANRKRKRRARLAEASVSAAGGRSGERASHRKRHTACLLPHTTW